VINRKSLVRSVAEDIVNFQFRCARVDDRTVLAGDNGDRDAHLAHPSQPHAVARVELLQNFTVRTVVHARVGQHPIDVDAQQSDVPGSTGDVGQLPSSAGAGAGARSSFHSSAEPGKTVSRATSTAAIRPISRSNWLAAIPSPGLLAVSIFASMTAPARMCSRATTLLPSRTRTGSSAGATTFSVDPI